VKLDMLVQIFLSLYNQIEVIANLVIFAQLVLDRRKNFLAQLALLETLTTSSQKTNAQVANKDITAVLVPQGELWRTTSAQLGSIALLEVLNQ